MLYRGNQFRENRSSGHLKWNRWGFQVAENRKKEVPRGFRGVSVVVSGDFRSLLRVDFRVSEAYQGASRMI